MPQKPLERSQSQTSGSTQGKTQSPPEGGKLPADKPISGAEKDFSKFEAGGNQIGFAVENHFNPSTLNNTQTTHSFQVGKDHGNIQKIMANLFKASGQVVKSDGTDGVYHGQVKLDWSALGFKHDKTTPLGKDAELKTKVDGAGNQGSLDNGFHLNTNKGERKGMLWFHNQTKTGVDASTEVNVGNKNAGAGAKLEAYGKAEGEASADVVINPENGDYYGNFKLGGSAGVGVKLTGNIHLGPLKAELYSSIEKGVGASVGGGAGMQNGVLAADFDLGAMMISGLKAGGRISLDTKYFNKQTDPFDDSKEPARQEQPQPPHFSQPLQLNRMSQLERDPFDDRGHSWQPQPQPPHFSEPTQLKRTDRIAKEEQPQPPQQQPGTSSPLQRQGNIPRSDLFDDSKHAARQKPEPRPPFSQPLQLNRMNQIPAEQVKLVQSKGEEPSGTESQLKRQGHIAQP